jgi:hypothetical protein
MRVRLVGEVRTGSTAGVARSTILRLGLGLVVVVVAGLHLVVVTERSVRAVLVGGTTEELLAIGSAVLLVATSALRLAAADGEHPEETGSDGEGGCDRDTGEESTVDITLDTVELGCVSTAPTTVPAKTPESTTAAITRVEAIPATIHVKQEKMREQLEKMPRIISAARAMKAAM